MYLAILLIIVAILVFYNEIDSKMNIAEYILLSISLIVIIGASVNYIKINKINEGFTSNNKNEYYTNVKEKDIIILNSEDSEEYLDPDKKTHSKNSFINSKDNAYMENQKSSRHINKINDLLGISSNFVDIPVPTTMDNYMPTTMPTTMDNYMPTTMPTTMDTTVDTTIPTTMPTTMDTTMDTTIPTEYETEDYKNEINENEIKSIFNPKVIIGKGKGKNNSNNNNNDNGFGSNGYSSRWNSVFKNDGFGFDDTMNPVYNLWNDNHGYYDNSDDGNTNGKNSRGCNTNNCNTSNVKTGISSDEWTQNMDSYNKGKWQRNQYNRPSDYVDYIYPSGYGTFTPENFSNTMNQDIDEEIDQDIYGNTSSDSINNSNPKITLSSNIKNSKACAPYANLDLDENQAGDLIVKDYKQSKKWVAGYTYVPPVHWDVPQKRSPVCNLATPNVHKLTGLMDKGLPINALELTETGYIADTEDTVKLSNVGSMIPKFNYQEQPFSKPYV